MPWSVAAAARGVRRRSPASHRTAGTTTERLRDHLDLGTGQILGCAQRLRPVVAPTPERQVLRTRPGVGWVLAVGLGCESGDSARFPRAAHRAADAGTTPRVHASGGRTRSGPLRGDVTRYRTWAVLEAARPSALHRQVRPHRHVRRRSARLQQRTGHPKAVGAVARPRAEARAWILTKRERSREPAARPASSREEPARDTPCAQDARPLSAPFLRDPSMPR